MDMLVAGCDSGLCPLLSNRLSVVYCIITAPLSAPDTNYTTGMAVIYATISRSHFYCTVASIALMTFPIASMAISSCLLIML